MLSIQNGIRNEKRASILGTVVNALGLKIQVVRCRLPICRTTLRGWERYKSESAQRQFTDCLAALGDCVGLLQILDANRAKCLRLC